MKAALPTAAIFGWLLAATAVLAQSPAEQQAPTVLNAQPSAKATAAPNVPEPYAGQKPAGEAAGKPATAAAPAIAIPAPVPAKPPTTAAAPPVEATSPAAKAAATAAKAASEAKPVPEGPEVKPLAKGAAGATGDAKTDAKGGEAKQEAKSEPKSDTIPTVAKPAPPKPTLLIAIDLTTQKLSVTEDDVAKFKWSISSGRTGYLTPRGTFRPVWMTKMWYSRKYDYAPMPHAIFFHGGTAIHGTDSVYALGRPASHGCVRLSPSNAATLYKLVTKHGKQKTQITVFGTPKASPKIASNRDDERDEPRARRYQNEPWWNDDDDDFPPPVRRRAYDNGYERSSRYGYPPRSRRYVRDFDPYDYDF